jgi:hypothetical protein
VCGLRTGFGSILFSLLGDAYKLSRDRVRNWESKIFFKPTVLAVWVTFEKDNFSVRLLNEVEGSET